MELGVVVGSHGRGNAALRITGVALGGIRLGEDDHAAGRRERERRSQPRDPTADDQEVCIHIIYWRWGPTPAPQRELTLMPRGGVIFYARGAPPPLARAAALEDSLSSPGPQA